MHLVQIITTLAILLGITGIGAWREITTFHALQKRLDFLLEYVNKFTATGQDYLSNSTDNQALDWLLMNVEQAESELGSAGVVRYQPPFANYIDTRFALLPNTLSGMRDGSAPTKFVPATRDLLLVRYGTLRKAVEARQQTALNPAVWFAAGVQQLVLIPGIVLRSFGLLSAATYDRLSSSLFTKTVSFLVGLIGLISAVFTIALGWGSFLHLLHV